MADPLTTKERVKTRLQITSTDFDTVLDRIIAGVSKRIAQITGRRFTQATFTHELHDGSDLYGTRRRHLIVKNAPLQSISAVEYKSGLNTDPTWTAYTANDYDVNLPLGLLRFPHGLPAGKQNIRITYVGGYSGHSIGIVNYWVFNVTPTGTVDGSNRTFTLPEDANEIIVYADGVRIASANVTFTEGSNTFTLASGMAPYSTIAVDYEREASDDDTEDWLPEDLVEVAEKAVVRTFKKRSSEGRSSEGFEESQITWEKNVFYPEDMAVINSYRRGYNI